MGGRGYPGGGEVGGSVLSEGWVGWGMLFAIFPIFFACNYGTIKVYTKHKVISVQYANTTSTSCTATSAEARIDAEGSGLGVALLGAVVAMIPGGAVDGAAV
eukprot:Hpha_TRINITY_DN16417_c8_g2::TRINITY_DN16417_c8_g2_i2::g.164058::m.164058